MSKVKENGTNVLKSKRYVVRMSLVGKNQVIELTNKKGDTYYLHSKDVTLRGGRQQTIYFFARDVRSGSLDAVPAGYKVMETERTGMPVLKKG